MPDQQSHYVDLSMDVTDTKAFYAWAAEHVPTWEFGDPDQSTSGLLLAIAMQAMADVPGVSCYGGGAHTDYDDRRPVAGRTPAFHRHVNEHAHPDGGKPHMHQLGVEGPRVAGRHYFAPDDRIPARALHEPEAGF